MVAAANSKSKGTEAFVVLDSDQQWRVGTLRGNCQLFDPSFVSIPDGFKPGRFVSESGTSTALHTHSFIYAFCFSSDSISANWKATSSLRDSSMGFADRSWVWLFTTISG